MWSGNKTAMVENEDSFTGWITITKLHISLYTARSNQCTNISLKNRPAQNIFWLIPGGDVEVGTAIFMHRMQSGSWPYPKGR